MSLCKNTIRPSDISITPIKVKYQSTFLSDFGDQTFPSSSISTNFGMNLDPFEISYTGSMSIIYRLVKQLYYQNNFTGSSINPTASYWNWNQQSTAASASHEWENRYLPTGSSDKIAVIAIPSILFGENISRKTLNLRPIIGNEYNLVDDGNGNIVDTFSNNKHVGNVIYSNGVIIITDPFYAPGFISPTDPPDPYYTPVGSATGYVNTTTGQYVRFTD